MEQLDLELPDNRPIAWPIAIIFVFVGIMMGYFYHGITGDVVVEKHIVCEPPDSVPMSKEQLKEHNIMRRRGI